MIYSTFTFYIYEIYKKGFWVQTTQPAGPGSKFNIHRVKKQNKKATEDEFRVPRVSQRVLNQSGLL